MKAEIQLTPKGFTITIFPENSHDAASFARAENCLDETLSSGYNLVVSSSLGERPDIPKPDGSLFALSFTDFGQ